jgi:hypothetical protein
LLQADINFSGRLLQGRFIAAAEQVLLEHCRNVEDFWRFLGCHLLDLSFLTASSTFFRSEAVVMTYATSS